MTPMTPHSGGSKSASVTTTSAIVTLDRACNQIMLQPLSGGSIAYYATGETTATATINDTPLQAGAVYTFTKPKNHNAIAFITSAGTATVLVTPGEGA